jgi:hypothetical protein
VAVGLRGQRGTFRIVIIKASGDTVEAVINLVDIVTWWS